MKLSREKQVHLSHVIVDALAADPELTLKQASNDVRLVIFDSLKAEMKRQDEIDASVRHKITSQKREIVEGSREWDILYRKYYEEELDKYRKVR